MIITRKHLSRRTFLRGASAMIGLPLLDAMVPALGFAQGVKRTPPARLCFVYIPNGVVMQNWTPSAQGVEFEFTPILKPLESFRQHTLLLSGLMDRNANALGDGGGDHARAGASFLTGAHPRKTGGSNIQAGISADQVAAEAIGNQTRLPSLQLGLDDNRTVGHCDSGYSCAYTNSISWRTPSTPLPPQTNPRHVFDRLFGNFDATLDAATRARRARYRQSILDSTIAETQRLGAELGPEDRRKIEEYLTAIREIEQRIQRLEQQGPVAQPTEDRPAGIPVDFAEHARLMYDLQFLAFQADLTRITTMMIGREGSVRTYEQIGVPEPHHPLSHHQNRAESLAKLTKINTYHVELFAQFIAKLHATRDGDCSLLDRSMIVYGSAIADSNRHIHERLPVVVMGKGNNTVTSGRHINYQSNTPLTNLYVALLERMNVRPERIGDSTGLLEI
jgi:Protein of unknown function (DUF1552)